MLLAPWITNGQPGGEQVGQHYDPMIAKVLARGPDRDAALATLQDALTELEVRHEAPVPFAPLGNMHALADARVCAAHRPSASTDKQMRGCTP